MLEPYMGGATSGDAHSLPQSTGLLVIISLEFSRIREVKLGEDFLSFPMKGTLSILFPDEFPPFITMCAL